MNCLLSAGLNIYSSVKLCFFNLLPIELRLRHMPRSETFDFKILGPDIFHNHEGTTGEQIVRGCAGLVLGRRPFVVPRSGHDPFNVTAVFRGAKS